MSVNKERVERLIAGLANFGRIGSGGVTRLAYSELDRKAQDWLLMQAADLELRVREDAVGNLFLRLPGADETLPPVAIGSHLDTVVDGGAYDGMTGVVAGLEIARLLKDEKRRRALEIIVFRAEESSRFGFGTMGSKFLCGKGDPDKFSAATRTGDVSFKEALQSWGCDPAQYEQAKLRRGCYDSFWELHIEQGKVLEETGATIGIVHNIAAPTRFKITVDGMADHSGATPMDFRRDALVSSAKIILAVQKAALAEKMAGTVATVGIVETEPGSINVVPGRAVLWVDVRGVDMASIERTLRSIDEAVAEVAAADNVSVSLATLTADTPVALSGELAALLAKVCEKCGLANAEQAAKPSGKLYRHMNSGAGHDAMNMAELCPTAMLFVPCRAGVSHNPAEYADIGDIAAGIEILAEAVRERLNG